MLENEVENELPGPVSPEPAKPNRKKPRRLGLRPGIGGTYSHKSTCTCNPCKSRRREKEALAIAAGTEWKELDSEGNPLKPVVCRNGRRMSAPRSLRHRAAQYLHLSMMNPNQPVSAIAEKMGISRTQLYNVIKDGQSAGFLTFDDPLERIEHQIIPKVVDNLNFFLDAKDKTVTIEAAKGTLFKSYQDSKGISDGNTTVLALKIEQADGGSEVKVLSGHIVGRPKGLPSVGEIVDES